MKYYTFQNKIVDSDNMSHEHLSNIYWYSRVLMNQDCHREIMNQLQKRFNGHILPYNPNPNFVNEISLLDKRGHLVWREENDVRVANIMFEGKKVGEAFYIDAYRQNLINKILE